MMVNQTVGLIGGLTHPDFLFIQTVGFIGGLTLPDILLR